MIFLGQKNFQPGVADLLDRSSAKARGLIAFWPLNDGAGLIARDLVGSNHGTLVGGPTWGIGENGRAVVFDGANDYIGTALQLSTTNAAQPYTIIARVKTSDATGTVVQQYSSGVSPQRFAFQISGGKIVWFKGGSTSVTSLSSINDNKWHTLAGVKAGSGSGQVQIYVDGIPNGAAGTDANAFENTSIKLGGGANFTSGAMQYVGICNLALSASDIMDLHVNPNRIYAPRRLLFALNNMSNPIMFGGQSVSRMLINGQTLSGCALAGSRLW